MRVLQLLSVLISVLCFSACQNEKNEVANMGKDLMSLHDTEMAKMDIMYGLSQKLVSILDTVSSEQHQQDIQVRIQKLKEADESMMNWMRNYKEPDPAESDEAKLKYYSEEMEKMKSVKQKMDESIGAAQEYLRKYETKAN